MSSMFNEPYFEVGVDALQPFMVSLALSLVALSTFSTIGRVAIGRRRAEGWTGQVLNLLATLLALVHTVVLIYACNAGLGKHDDLQRQDEFGKRSKLRYTTDLLAIAAISCSKGSASAIVHQIVGIVHKRLQRSLLAATALFAVFAMFAGAFQCSGSAPRYWLNTPKACNQGAIEYIIVVLNIITDLWLAVVALPIIWRLQTATSKRIRVMALLGARIFVVAAEFAQLINLARVLDRSGDRSWNDAILVRYTIITMELSILCANLPILSPWLDNLISGHNGIHVTTHGTYLDTNRVSRHSRIFSSRVGSRPKPLTAPSSIPARCQADANSDHGSQTGILKTTAIKLDRADADRQTADLGSRAAVQEQYKW